MKKTMTITEYLRKNGLEVEEHTYEGFIMRWDVKTESGAEFIVRESDNYASWTRYYHVVKRGEKKALATRANLDTIVRKIKENS